MVSWSFGRGKWGCIEETASGSWSDLRDLLADAALIPRAVADKDHAPWVTPMIQKPGATQRRNEDVATMGGWTMLDLDTGNWSIAKLRSKLMFLTYVLWTTTSSAPDDMHWRIGLLCDRPFNPHDEHARLFHWLAERFDHQVDSRCRNPSRIFYAPASWGGDPPVFQSSYGRPLQIDRILALVPATRLTTPEGLVGVALRRAPDGTEVITRGLLDAAMSAPKGGRMFKLLTGAAKRFRLEGWALSEQELAAAGLAANASFSPGNKREDILRESGRALRWAESHFSPQTPIERMRSRLAFDEKMRLSRFSPPK